MPRITEHFWFCTCKQKNSPADRICINCGANHYERHANVRASERAVVDINRRTGEISVPGRADVPLHWKQVRDGYERVEVTSAVGGSGTNEGLSLACLESKGLVHEASTYAEGRFEPKVDVNLPERKTLAELGLNT